MDSIKTEHAKRVADAMDESFRELSKSFAGFGQTCRKATRELEQFRWDLITSEAIAHRKSEKRAWILERLGIVVAILLLCIAMSDGPWFPWANLGSLGVLGLIVWRAKNKGIL